MSASNVAERYSGLVLADSYRVLGAIGTGGMGSVYEAEHVRLGMRVAIKFLRADVIRPQPASPRFQREAQALAALRSPNVVRVLDCGEVDGEPYLVMERLFGQDLRQLLKNSGRLPAERAVRLLRHACYGLSAVHRAGLVHRDLKPANLFVEAHGRAPEVCKILDFGVVKAPETDSTARGAVLGTLRYMAPEQLADAKAASPRSDLYSLGLVLFECLTGAPAHSGDTAEEIMFQILHGPTPVIGDPNVPDALKHLLAMVLHRNADKRMQSADELADALRVALVAGPSTLGEDDVTMGDATNPSVRFRSGSALRRTWTPLHGAFVAGGVVLGLLAGASLASAWNSRAGRTPAKTQLTERPGAPLHEPVDSQRVPSSSSSRALPAAQSVATITTERSVERPVMKRSAGALAPSASARPSDRRTIQSTLFDEVDPYVD